MIFDKRFRIFSDLEAYIHENKWIMDNDVGPFIGLALGMSQSQRFYIPDVDFANEQTARALVSSGEVKLPYELTCVVSEIHSHDIITMYYQDDNVIHMSCAIRYEMSWTVMPRVKFYISEDGDYEFLPAPADMGNSFFGAYFKHSDKYEKSAEVFMKMVLAQGWKAACSLAAMLSLKNVKPFSIEPPEALSKKRIKHGKKPLYSYHVLEVDGDLWLPHRRDDPTGATIRSHLRRGHIRRLPSGNVWVRACFVRGGTPGFVDKDYSVDFPAQPYRSQ